jgi:FixJ family two-component response regulator
LENAPDTVAVIDDDPSMLRSVERLLNANGSLTEGYSSAEAFLSQAQKSLVRCIVLDIHLGGMSGIELWRQLKNVGINLPVIFITAVDDETLEREALNAGCIAYLHKPFAAEALVAAINRALQPSSLD